MTRKTIAIVIIILVFLFPFRWAFLEYPDPVKAGNTMVDAGRIQYMFYFLLTIFGFLTFLFLSVTDGPEHKKEK